jgi:NAD(P)H-nitrite reductase large subunit
VILSRKKWLTFRIIIANFVPAMMWSIGKLQQFIRALVVHGATLPAVKKCYTAGTSNGGCEAQVKTILAAELQARRGSLSNNLYEQFHYSPQDLMTLIGMEGNPVKVDNFEKILAKHGRGGGCEIFKPTEYLGIFAKRCKTRW